MRFVILSAIALGLIGAGAIVAGRSTAKDSCCDELTLATCTGSASCRACKNCNSCKHCGKNGGSCGVCKPATKPSF